MARLRSSEGSHAVALPLYEEASRIFASLVEQAPGFAEWVSDKEFVERAGALPAAGGQPALTVHTSDTDLDSQAPSGPAAPAAGPVVPRGKWSGVAAVSCSRRPVRCSSIRCSPSHWARTSFGTGARVAVSWRSAPSRRTV